MFLDIGRFYRKDTKCAKEQGAVHEFYFCNSSRNDEIAEDAVCHRIQGFPCALSAIAPCIALTPASMQACVFAVK
jgi:hypothetical protein